jgi:hypothetical protein
LPKGEKENRKKTKGGRFIRGEEPGKWIDTANVEERRCLDFTCLVLNIMLVKLANVLSLHTKMFLSQKGDIIYLLVNADSKDVKDGAEIFGENVQMEVGESDLASLQPCDQLLRPLFQLKFPQTLDKRFREEVKKNVEELKPYFSSFNADDNKETRIWEHDVSVNSWDIYLGIILL